MNIGIDIDGVINNLEEYHKAYGSKFCYEKKLLFKYHPDEYELMKMYEWNAETERAFYQRFYSFFISSPEFLRPHAKEVINKLHETHKIIIITARLEEDTPNSLNSSMHQITEDWLTNNGIIYDLLVFSPENKAAAMTEHKIDLMIEDNPIFLRGVETQFHKYICFDATYNRSKLPRSIMRIHSWYELLTILDKKKGIYV